MIKDIFKKFNDLNILIIGDVMIDAYMWGGVDRISPEAPIPIVSVSKRENRLGGAANVALNVKAMGANPVICTIIGDDEKGKIFFELLEKRSLTSKGVLVNTERKTTVKTRVISDSQHMLRVDEEMSCPITSEIEKKFVDHITEILLENNIDAIIFEDYDKGVITPFVIKNIVDAANEKGVPTLVDPKKRNFTEYKNVTLFKPNYKELVEGLKLDIEKTDYKGIFNASQEIHNDWNVKYVFTTLSEYGVFISNKDEYHVIPAEIRDIADVSGAGDTVISMAALCLAVGLSEKKIAEISNKAGGLVCENIGVVPIDKEKLILEYND